MRTTQFTLLQVLARRGTVTQGALGDVLAIDSTTLTRSLRPLAAEGWIRSETGEDRREVIWAITPGGQRVLDRAEGAWERAQERLRGRIGSERWTQLLEELGRVAAAARTRDPEPEA